jgi:hypothetical protein
MTGCSSTFKQSSGDLPPRRRVDKRSLLVSGVLAAAFVLAACGSSSAGHSSSGTSSSSSGTPPPASSSGTSAGTAPPATSPTTSAGTTSAAKCPTLAQAEAALGGTYGGPVRTPTAGRGIVCEYTSSSPGDNAGAAIFAHQSPSVFAGQVAHAPGAPAMPAIPGVGDGAYGQTAGGRSVVNAYSNASRTLVAAQSSAGLSQTESLARIALADN